MHQIELFMKHPYQVQNESLNKLIYSAKNTQWGKQYNYKNIKNKEQFKNTVPLQNYDSLKPFIDKIRQGQQNVLWSSDIKWFAKSSGTTNDKSKYLPISQEALNMCHFDGGRDMVAMYCTMNPQSKLFTGKNLNLPGSLTTDNFGNYQSINGDLSAIVAQNLPKWMDYYRTPDMSITLLENWDEKLEKIVKATANENVVSITGIPSWFYIILERLLDYTGKNSIAEIWPNLDVYFHGGVNFLPYKNQFKNIINKANMNYQEVYNASEGVFGIQDQSNSNELLLMLDYGIYYEFMPVENVGTNNTNTLSLDEVKLNTNYALIISTNAGLWRYMVGDTVMFTALNPFRIIVTGRTQHFINAFGEELNVDNADKALQIACEKTNSQIKEYSAAPVYLSKNKSGAHEWCIEFVTPPNNITYFTEMLDNALKSLNSDYEAKRYNNLILQQPIINALPQGTFYKWLASKNKLGGQHKIPRLSNDRKVVEEINAIYNQKNIVNLEKELELSY
jgi:hypothetical protein